MAAAASVADKQLDTLYKTVGELKEIGFPKFQEQLRRQAFAYEWDAHILDLTLPIPAAPDLEARRDRRNAYMVIMNKCDGHTVEHLLESCEQGDAQGAFRIVHNYHHRDSQAGKTVAFKDFYGATMANTDTDIVSWVARVRSLAKILIAAGGQANEAAQLSILLDGLLPDFKPIKTILDQTDGLDYATATRRIVDFAQTEHLTHLTKGGGKSVKNNTFAADDSSMTHAQELSSQHMGPQNSNARDRFPTGQKGDMCRGWVTAMGCKFGDDCHFKHAGPGRLAPPQQRFVRRTKVKEGDKTSSTQSPTVAAQSHTAVVSTVVDNSKPTVAAHASAAKCNYCNGGHLMRTCPSLQIDNAAGNSNVHMVSETKGVDYVFMTKESTNVHSNEMLTTSYFTTICATVFVMCAMFAFTTTTAPSYVFEYVDMTHAMGLLVMGIATWYHDSVLPIAERYASSLKLILVLLFILCSLAPFATAGTTIPMAPHVNATSYFCDSDSIITKNNYEWCSDTGTNRFVTNDTNDFIPGTFVSSDTNVSVGGGNTTSPGYGTVIIQSHNHDCAMQFNNVLLMPKCSKKLMPASTFIVKGCSLTFDNYDKVTLRAKDNSPILSGIEIDGLYYYHATTTKVKCASPNMPDTQIYSATSSPDRSFFGLPVGKHISAAGDSFSRHLLEAHWAYGHIHFDKLRKLLGLKKGDDPECPTCAIAKSRQVAMSKHAAARSTRVNHRMHMDIGFTRDCNYKFQLYMDDYTRVSYLDVLDSKDEALEKWVELKDHLENNHAPWKFAYIHTDSEPLYSTPQWDSHCKDNGLEHEFSSRYRHEQNGVIERGMQAVGIPFRCIMIQGCAPESKIPDALRHANVIRNNSPTKANKGWTPREKQAGMKLPPNKRLLRGPLFCLVFAHIYEEERAKHAPRGVACVYLGYDDVNNAYKVMEWVSGVTYYNADITFHPNTFPFRANPNRTPNWLRQFDDFAPHVTSGIGLSGGGEEQSASIPRDIRPIRQPSSQAIRNVPDVDIPPNGLTCDDATQNETMLANMQAGYSTDNFVVHTFGEDPKTWQEAMSSKHAEQWLNARCDEMASFERHNVYTVVPRTQARGKRIFKARVVLKIKINAPTEENPQGSIEKFKYRCTVAAFTRMLTQGIDYAEKYASTVRWNSIKLMIAMAVMYDYDIVLYDIATFFLYGKLDHEVFMEQAEGWDTTDFPREHYIWLLNKTLYGLPEASCRAQLVLKGALTDKGTFKATTADDCVYVNTDTMHYAALGAHVDDIVGVGTKAGLDQIKTTLTNTFDITEKRNPDVITGVQIDRNRPARWLKLHQSFYIKGLLEKYGKSDCTPCDTPMDPGTARALMLLPTEPADPAACSEYQAVVGSLIWLFKTRPDMLFTGNLLSRFLKCATKAHLTLALNRPLRYLRGTMDYGIVFQPGVCEWKLSGAADADLAGDLATARSTSGYYTRMGEFGAVACSSALEKKISTSTGQAETYALQSLVKEVVWDRHMLADLKVPCKQATSILTDNDGVLKQSTKTVNHTAAKHYRIAQAYIRSKGEDGTVLVGAVHTSLNPSDMFTKALHAPAFVRHREKVMGPQVANSSK